MQKQKQQKNPLLEFENLSRTCESQKCDFSRLKFRLTWNAEFEAAFKGAVKMQNIASFLQFTVGNFSEGVKDLGGHEGLDAGDVGRVGRRLRHTNLS